MINFRTTFLSLLLGFFICHLLPEILHAATTGDEPISLDLVLSPIGLFCLLIFVIAYAFVMAEEYTHYRKAKPVILAATIIWGVIALYASNDPNLSTHWAEKQFKHLILEFAELFFFYLLL